MSNGTALDSALHSARIVAERATAVLSDGWSWISLSSSASVAAAAAAAGPLGGAMGWIADHQRMIVASAFLLLCALIYYLSAHVRRPHCMYAHTDFNLWMMRQLPRLHRAYWPTFYLTHEVPQAAVGSFVRFHPRLRKDPAFQREILRMADGELIALDWLHTKPLATSKDDPAAVPESEDTTPIAFACHGLAGHTDEVNMQYLCLEIRRVAGARFAIMNRRGCAHDMVLQNETIYLWGCTADLRETLAHVKRRFPKAPLFGIGLSAGSNLLTKYLGESGLDSLFDAGFSVANSFDVQSTSRALHAKPFYANIMVSILLDLLNRNIATFKKIEQRQQAEAKQHTLAECKHEHSDRPASSQSSSSSSSAARSRVPSLNLARVRTIKSVLEWDEHFTMLTHAHRGFKDLDEFYTAQSTTPDLIANISVPVLNLHALDDPILPAKRALDYTRALESNPHIICATTIRGGHLGFTEGLWPFNKPTWLETLAAEWVRAMSTPEALEKLRALRRRDREAKEEIRLADRERRIAAEKESHSNAAAAAEVRQDHEGQAARANGHLHAAHQSHPVPRPRSPMLHPNPNQPPPQSSWNAQSSRRSKSPSLARAAAAAAAAASNGHSHRSGSSHGPTAATSAGSLDFSFGSAADLGIGPIATYMPSPTESPPAESGEESASQQSAYSLADYLSLTGEPSQPPVMHHARSDEDDEDDADVSDPDASPFVPAPPFAQPHGFADAVASYPAYRSPSPSTPPAAGSASASSLVVSQSIVSVLSVTQPRPASPMLPTQDTMDYEHGHEHEQDEAPSLGDAARGRPQPAWKSGAAAAATAAAAAPSPQRAQSRSQKRPVSAAHAASSAHAAASAPPASPAKRRRSAASPSPTPSSRPERAASRTPSKKKN